MNNIFLSLFIFNFIILIFVKKIISIYGLYDLPDSNRKIHKVRTSKIGGLIIFLNLIFFLLLSLVINSFVALNWESTALNIIIFLGCFIFFFNGIP